MEVLNLLSNQVLYQKLKDNEYDVERALEALACMEFDSIEGE